MSEENPVKREDVATADDVRKLLEIDDEKLSDIQIEQARLLKLHRSRARLSSEDFAKARAIELEIHHKKTGNKDGLAESYAAQGRFEEAAKVAKSKELKKVFREKRDALRKSSDCKCDAFYTADDGTILPNQHVESYVGKLPLLRCRKCNKLSAIPMPSHLAEQREVRRKSEKGAEIKAEEFFKKINA